MIQFALVSNSESIWHEDFDVESKETAKEEILECINNFNRCLQPGEPKRRLHSMPIKNKKCLYFADMMGDLEKDLDQQIVFPLIEKGIYFNKIKTTEAPPFGNEIYDILFFDYGGMSMGNSCMEHFCRYIIDEAKDYPNRMYVMVSTFTKQAMDDALSIYGEEIKLHNIFLDIDSFAANWNKINNQLQQISNG